MKHTVYIIIFLILPVVWIVSCKDDTFQQSDRISQESPAMKDVTSLLSYYSGVSLPDMAKTFHVDSVSSTRGVELAKGLSGAKVDWENIRSFKKGKTDIHLIPLQPDSPVLGLSYTRIDGKKQTQVSVAYFKLQVRKTQDRLIGRVMTYIPDSKYRRRKHNKISELGYDLRGSRYSGVCLYSTLDGIFVYGEKYNNGQLLFRFRPRHFDYMHGDTLSLHGDSLKTEVPNYKIHINLFNDNKTTRGIMAYDDDESGVVLYCSFCGMPVDECSCVVITPDPEPTPPWELEECFECGLPVNFCICCRTCGHYPCTCTWGPAPTPDPSEPDPSTPDIPSPNPEKHQFTTSKIKEITKKAVDKVIADHNGNKSKAYCNEGVRNAFNQLFSTKELNNLNANAMTKHWKNNPSSWEKISMDEARRYANDGYFVVVGWINTEGSGHVAVIVPGDGDYREKWGGTLPNTMDTGSNKRWTSKSLQYSFGADKKNDLLYFKFK